MTALANAIWAEVTVFFSSQPNHKKCHVFLSSPLEGSDSVMRRASTEKWVPFQTEAQNESDGAEPSQ